MSARTFIILIVACFALLFLIAALGGCTTWGPGTNSASEQTRESRGVNITVPTAGGMIHITDDRQSEQAKSSRRNTSSFWIGGALIVMGLVVFWWKKTLISAAALVAAGILIAVSPGTAAFIAAALLGLIALVWLLKRRPDGLEAVEGRITP